jgi:cytochrome c2
MARCQACGAELDDATQRWCGGDRCLEVFMGRPSAARTSLVSYGPVMRDSADDGIVWRGQR